MMKVMYLTVCKFFETLDRKLDCLDDRKAAARPDTERLPDFSDLRDDEIDELFATFLARKNDLVTV